MFFSLNITGVPKILIKTFFFLRVACYIESDYIVPDHVVICMYVLLIITTLDQVRTKAVSLQKMLSLIIDLATLLQYTDSSES